MEKSKNQINWHRSSFSFLRNAHDYYTLSVVLCRGEPLNSITSIPLGMPQNVTLNMFLLDNTQETLSPQLLSLPPSSLSMLEYRYSPTVDELDNLVRQRKY
ncbi:16789_t:CDS:2 [Gigaspora margarita]|uniref:16789_t:CDS:1 n=1 Tax=Gigaspora margarita TaxID=4874 RepID=A0ABN7UHG0_GIGMA|nr:16789_t:CDS:2 [Gigaspora margarita]